MIREETYHRLANEFAVGIGIAEWSQPLYGIYTNIKEIPDDIKVIILTNYMIERGIYQKGIKEVMRLETKYGNRRIKKSTIYEKAITNVTEGK